MSPIKESFVRWQSIRIGQLGHVSGLILTFSAATLGFAIAVVKDSSYNPTCCWVKASMLVALIAQELSLFLGLWCAVNRLRDFRKTSSIARDREEWTLDKTTTIEEIDRKLESRRDEVKKIGDRTWLLLYWQIGTFAFGVLALTLSFAIAYHPKLF